MPASIGPPSVDLRGATTLVGSGAEEWSAGLSIEVCNESGIALDESLVASVARHALDAMHVNPAAELSILAVTTEVMSELHERWMDEPGPTDVMSFPMDELADESRRPDAPDMGPALLGDIVLCPEFARAQARTAGHALADELHLLTVHGVLHLLGYDHAEPDQEREMFGLQNKLLREWRTGREQAAAREAQRRSDSAVLGTVGLEDA
jgi:probable rRNA maturation factor